MNSEESSTPHEPNDDARLRLIEEIVDHFLKQLQLGIADSVRLRQELAGQHPELNPELSERLAFVESIFSAIQRQKPAIEFVRASESSDHPSVNSDGNHPRVVRINCPHCGNRVNLVTSDDREVTCASCGSAIRIDAVGSTRTDTGSIFPQKIGRFEIQGSLGQGSFGTVYRAFDPLLSRMVAVKVPRSGTFQSPNEKERFLREARNAASLRHPNIVNVHEVNADGQLPYIVTDYIEGITLKDLLSGRRLGFEESAQLLIDIAAGIEFAHQNGTIHRDVKPGNVLLDRAQRPYITDFGLALRAEAEITMTADGEILGTPAYMSPEQAIGAHSKITARSDVYSLGAVMYRMLCFELPFRGSQRMLVHQLIHDDPRPPRRVNDSIPRDLETITLKAMAKDPEKRYASAKEFSDEIRRWLNHEPIHARPIGRLTRLMRWRRRHPAIAALVSGIGLLLAIVAAISINWALRERQVARVELENSEKIKARETVIRQRLISSHLQNGIDSMSQGRWARSLSWCSQALDLCLSSPIETGLDLELQRIRIGLLLRNLPTLNLLRAVKGQATVVSFDTVGRQILVGTDQGKIHIFNDDGKQIVPALDHDEFVMQARFSPDGNRIITVGTNHEAILWDAKTGQRINGLRHRESVRWGEFSADSQQVATAGLDGFARVWSALDGQPIAELQHSSPNVERAQFYPDDTHLITSCRVAQGEEREIRFWDMATHTELGQKITLDDFPSALDFDPETNRMVTSCVDGSVQLWDTKTNEAIGPALRNLKDLRAAYFLKNSSEIVAVQHDGTIILWNIESGNQFSRQHTTAISHSAIDRQRRFLVVANSNGGAGVYWLSSLRSVASSLPGGDKASAVAFDTNGRRVVVGSVDGSVRVWDLAGLAPSLPLLMHSKSVDVARFSPDGTRIVTASTDNSAKLFRTETAEQVGELMLHDGPLSDCAINRDGTLIATASADRTVRIWSGFSAGAIGSVLKHDSAVRRLIFSPTEDILLTGTVDGVVIAWNSRFGELFRIRLDGEIRDLAFSSDGKQFAVVSSEPAASIWRSLDGTSIAQPLGRRDSVLKCSFSNDGRYLLTSCSDGTAKVWETAQSRLVAELSASDWIAAAQFDSSQTKIFSADYAGNIASWSRITVKPTKDWEYRDPSYQFTHCDLDVGERMVVACGERMVTGGGGESGDGAAILLEAKTGLLLSSRMNHFGNVRRAFFDSRGRYILTASYDSTARLWDITPDQTDVRTLCQIARVLDGVWIDAQIRPMAIDPHQLQSEFDETRSKTPSQFTCTSADIERWNDYVLWGLKLASAHPN